MSYWSKPKSTSSPSLDTTSFMEGIKSVGNNKSTINEFYEIEPAVVLDVILDKNHPYFKNFYLNPNQWPVDVNNKPPDKKDMDYTWMGKILVRLLYNQKGVEKEDLIWATPLESNISEYPLLNEIVGVVFYLGQYFYTKKINIFNTPNANADFNIELQFGGFRATPNDIIKGNRELKLKSTDTIKKPYSGPPSRLNQLGSIGYTGVLGRYFYYNNKIRSIKRREGDTIIESRFGQSIRFASYDDDRNNDKGYNSDFVGYSDYKGSGIKNPHFNGIESGGGNPMILIRNRQRPLETSNIDEKNVGGYIIEDINKDGSSIHMTSGVTLSSFKTNCIKKMWGDVSEEQNGFNGITTFKFPKLIGDQIVINSDRIILSSKKNELFQYSKKRMSFVTDDEYTIDAQNQIVLNTNNKTVLNSPAIYLGEYDQTNEPILLGQTTINWLYDLCNWLLTHTHWYNHNHPDAQGGTTGNSNPQQTQISVQTATLTLLRENLNTLMSRRVFTTGGGFSPGKNGIGDNSVNISVSSGKGVPGGWNGLNRKYNSSEKQTNITDEIVSSQNDYISSKIASDEAKSTIPLIKNNIKIIEHILKKINNKSVNDALKITNKQLKEAKENSELSLQWSLKAKKFSDEVTSSTDSNDVLRLESEKSAKDASDKSQYYNNLCQNNKKASDSAVIQSKLEVSKQKR